MSGIIQILIKNHVFLFFIILEILLLKHISSHNFNIESTLEKNFVEVSGYFFSKERKIKNLLSLKIINEQLLKDNHNLICENERLLNSIFLNDSTTVFSQKTQAQVVKNTFNKKQNFLIINKGFNDHIETQMGVISNNNLVGMTSIVSNNFCSVISLLNTDLMISAKIKNVGHFGTLSWNGRKFHELILEEIPKHAIFQIGDTIVTSGYSNIFPEGINIGQISRYEFEKNTNFLKIYVQPFVDFTKINFVFIIEPLFKKEREIIEKKLKD